MGMKGKLTHLESDFVHRDVEWGKASESDGSPHWIGDHPLKHPSC